MNENKNLQINDFENNRVYSILVSHEDYDKALSDNQFANSLLNHARIAAAAEEQPAERNNKPSIPSCSGINKKKVSSESLPPTELCLDSFSENVPSNSQKLSNIWSYEQTTCLIHSMATYYTDFNDPRKRKHIFENIANDLISAGFAVDTKNVQNKWKGLLRSYTKAKDVKNRTGQGPSRFLFYEIIDDIVGNQSKNNCQHALNSLPMSTEGDTETEETNSENVENDNEGEIGEQESEVEPPRSENNTHEEHPRSHKKRKRLSEQQLKKEYIDLKREEYERRQKRHEERCTIEKAQNEIERRKLEVLEEYLRNKTH